MSQRTRTLLRSMLLATGSLLLCAGSANAAPDAPVATSAPAAAASEALRVIITDVQGTVRVRLGADQPWQPAKAEMVVGENAEFRTGPRSSVTCVIPPDQTFTLDRLGTMSVLEAQKQGKTVKTDLAMKYGRVRYDIEAAGVEHRAIIRSPSSTLAVRGTRVALYDQPPFAPEAQSFIGRAVFGYAKQQVPVGGKTYARVTAGSTGAAETALGNSVVDPRSNLSLTETDQRLISDQVSRGAILSFDEVANIPVLRGGAGPLPDKTFSLNPPGPLDFYVRWTGNADLNLTLTLEKGNAVPIILSANFQPTELLYPGFSLNNTPSGGHIAFDDRGGPHGGTEIAFWDKLVPGLYGISARNVSGTATDFKFNVTLDGKPVDIITNELTRGTQIDRTIKPGQEIVGLVAIPYNHQLDVLPLDPGQTSKGSAAVVSAKSSDASASAVLAQKIGPMFPVHR